MGWTLGRYFFFRYAAITTWYFIGVYALVTLIDFTEFSSRTMGLPGFSIGLALSAFSKTMQQAMLYTFVLLMPMMLLSGLTSAISNMPTLMQYITLGNPLRYAIEMVQRVYLEGAGIAVVYNDMWPLVVIAAITLPVAVWLFRHRLV